MTQLGLMYSNRTVPGTPDLTKAVQCFQAAADKGDAPAKLLLGDCYLARQGRAGEGRKARARAAIAKRWPPAICAR